MKFIDLDPQKVKSRAGKIVPNSYGSYPAFIPNRLPFKIKYSEELTKLMSEAVLSIGNLNGVSGHFIAPLLMGTYLRKEALLSSKIEGTRTTLSEVIIEEKQKKEIKNEDVKEVVNYIRSLSWSIEKIQKESLSEDIIRGAHKILLTGVRGGNSEPGKYKIKQNWIGPSYDVSEASFIPCPHNDVSLLMGNLIKYANEKDSCPSLIKAGLLHYQFEIIHPFRDGNGRIGRMLIILFLIKNKILDAPLLYLSVFFEKYREEYNNGLYSASINDKLESWIKFFLKGVKIQSDDALERAKKIEKYYYECKETLQKESDSNKAIIVLDFLFENLYISIPEVAKKLKTYYPTAQYNVDILLRLNILKQHNCKKRNRIYFSPKLVEILGVSN